MRGDNFTLVRLSGDMLYVVAQVIDKRLLVCGVFARETDATAYCNRLKPNNKLILERRLDDLVLSLLDDTERR